MINLILLDERKLRSKFVNDRLRDADLIANCGKAQKDRDDAEDFEEEDTVEFGAKKKN